MTRAWRWALAAAVALQLAVLYWPTAPGVPSGLPLDKLVHAAVFGLVALTGVRAGLPVRGVVAVLLAHAVVSEVLQHLVLPYRSGDPLDALADAVGVLVGASLAGRRARARMDA